MRFRLGAMFVIVALMGIGLSVLESQTRDWRERRRLTLEIASYGGSYVLFDADNNVTWISVDDRILSPRIARFDTLEHFDLAASNVTDENLRHLRTLPRVMYLDLSGTTISDAGLTHLAGIERVGVLILNNTQVSDEGMDALAAINVEKGVALSGTNVTRQGIEYLKSKRPDIFVIHRDLGLRGDEEPAEPSDKHGAAVATESEVDSG